MDTSDSECFESADEDFLEENFTSVKKEKHIEESNSSEVKKETEKHKIEESVTTNEITTSTDDLDVNIDKKIDEKILTKEKHLLVIDDTTKSDFSNLKIEDKRSNHKDEEHKIYLENLCQEVDSWKIDDWDDIEDKKTFKKHEEDTFSESSVAVERDNNKISDKCKIEPEQKHTIETSEKEGNVFEDDWKDWGDFPENNKASNIPAKTSNTKDEKMGNKSWDSWGSWGVTSLLSTATSSVTNLTNQVTQSINTVLESGIGIPEPEELARLNNEEVDKEKAISYDPNTFSASNIEQEKGFNFKNILTGVSQITKLVETTGNKVITGGLGTLEIIGKKTVEVLQEGDPGLKKKRALLRIDSEKPNLSQILREAKEKSQEESKEEKKSFTKKVNYETLFDDHHGLIHLEALEMLSKQCNIKLSTVFESSGENLQEIQETIEQIRELCELSEDENEENLNMKEVEEKIKELLLEINIPISYDKFMSVWIESETWLNDDIKDISSRIIYEKAIDTLAELTAIAVEQYHKSAELLLIKSHRSTADEADSLVQITTILINFISHVASQFCKKLNESNPNSQNAEIKGFITNVFFEAANSSSYIKDAFKLLIPVIEVGAI